MLRHNERTSAFETFDDEQNCMCAQLRWAATAAMMMIHGNIVDNDIISLFIACELAQWEAQRGLMRVCVEFVLHSAMIEVIVIRNLYHQSVNKSLTMKLTSWRLSLLQFRREFYLLLVHWRATTLSLYIHDFECTSFALSSSLLVYIFFSLFNHTGKPTVRVSDKCKCSVASALHKHPIFIATAYTEERARTIKRKTFSSVALYCCCCCVFLLLPIHNSRKLTISR